MWFIFLLPKMEFYDNFIDTLAFLPASDILNTISACRQYQDNRVQIVRDVFIRRYPELMQDGCSYIGLEPTEFNLVYVDRVWDILSESSLTPLIENLSLMQLDEHPYPRDYETQSKELAQFSTLVSRV
jgi:hypothetical protein